MIAMLLISPTLRQSLSKDAELELSCLEDLFKSRGVAAEPSRSGDRSVVASFTLDAQSLKGSDLHEIVKGMEQRGYKVSLESVTENKGLKISAHKPVKAPVYY